MPGGLLIESFLVTAGRRSSQRAILPPAKTCRDEDRVCTADEADELVAAERAGGATKLNEDENYIFLKKALLYFLVLMVLDKYGNNERSVFYVLLN